MMKKKVTTLVAASLAALTLLAGCGSNGTADKKDGAAKGDKTLIVGTEPTFPPFEFTENEKDVGFDIDLAQAVCDKLGYKMEVKNLGFDALIPALKSGQIDLIVVNGFQKRVISQFGARPMAALWAEEKGLAFFGQWKRGDPRSFSALVMGRPTPEDGAFFQADWLLEYDARDLPRNLRL